MKVIYFDKIDSTSVYVKNNIRSLEFPCTVISASQTSGRGRTGKSFYSPKSTGLYMNVVFQETEKATNITPKIAVITHKYIRDNFCKCCKIKWVNDIYYNDRKVCGILTERIRCGEIYCISVGIGINVNTSDFPDELNNAGSLEVKTDIKQMGIKLAESIVKEIYNIDNNYVYEYYNKHSFLTGKEIIYSFNNKEYEGLVTGINKNFTLNVKNSAGDIFRLSSGEVTLKGIMKNNT